MDWDGKWLIDFNAGKTQLVLFDQFNKTGTIDVKMDGSVLKEKSSFKMLGLTFSSKWNWDSYIPSKHFLFSKKCSRRLEDVFRVTIFRLPRRLEDVFAIRLPKTSSTRFQGVFITSSRCICKTSSSRRLQEDVL